MVSKWRTQSHRIHMSISSTEGNSFKSLSLLKTNFNISIEYDLMSLTVEPLIPCMSNARSTFHSFEGPVESLYTVDNAAWYSRTVSSLSSYQSSLAKPS